MHDQMLMRVFSARDYEDHQNDAAILSISRGSKRPLEKLVGGEGEMETPELSTIDILRGKKYPVHTGCSMVWAACGCLFVPST